jgi:uroporphyrinogen-III decarboxylase
MRGEPVDRPPVSFYELNGLDEDPHDPDPFNIYSDPSWWPLIELTREKTDRIVMRGTTYSGMLPDPLDSLASITTTIANRAEYQTKRIRAGERVLTCRMRRDMDMNTVWTLEPYLKDVDDLEAFLALPPPEVEFHPDLTPVLQAEALLGDAGIVMIDTPDPLCLAAAMFEMGEFTVIAWTERELFHRLLEWFATDLHRRTELISEMLPGRLWRIYGPEYASAPYLSPSLFREYVVRYDRPMVAAIQRHGGYARVHAHGRLKAILDDIVSMEPDGLDPIEPPPQGDVTLRYVRQNYGENMALFGNLEVSDIEQLPTEQFAEKVKRALEEGTEGEGRGFVLMPSACPYGRELPARTMRNYEKIIEIVESY